MSPARKNDRGDIWVVDATHQVGNRLRGPDRIVGGMNQQNRHAGGIEFGRRCVGVGHQVYVAHAVFVKLGILRSGAVGLDMEQRPQISI